MPRPSILAAVILLMALTITACSSPDPATPGESAAAPGPLTLDRSPTVRGAVVVGQTLRVGDARWSDGSVETRYQWLRDGREIEGATSEAHEIADADSGSTLSVRLRPSRAEAADSVDLAVGAVPRVEPDLPRVVASIRYRIDTGRADQATAAEFVRTVEEVLASPRGWRRAGFELRHDETGSDFTVHLVPAAQMSARSSSCSPLYSCRVGDDVLINAAPWSRMTPAWVGAGGDLTGYRAMVVNHEVGHWLRVPHQSCSGPGRPAQVMQQQSKSLDGCRPTSWPTDRDRAIALAGPRVRRP